MPVSLMEANRSLYGIVTTSWTGGEAPAPDGGAVGMTKGRSEVEHVRSHERGLVQVLWAREREGEAKRLESVTSKRWPASLAEVV